MIEQQATVVKDNNGILWAQTERQSTCSACSAKKACGTGLLSEHVGKRFSKMPIPNNNTLTEGQQVNIAIPEQALLRGAFQVYIIPLLFLFAGAVIARSFEWGQTAEIMCGIFTFLFGFFWVKHRLNHSKLTSNITIKERVK